MQAGATRAMGADENTQVAHEEAPHLTEGSLLMHGESEDVICEVVDLCYGIDIPVPRAARRARWAKAARSLHSRILTSPAVDDGTTDAEDSPPVKPLLLGANCRVYAGEMIAVMVGLLYICSR